MNRGSSTAVGCIHRAPFVAGSYTVSYVVGVLELNRLYRSRPTFAFVLPNRRTFAKRMSTTLIRSPYTAPGSSDDVDSVTRPEVDQVVLWRDGRHVQHLLDERRRRRHPLHVLAFLSELRLIGCLGLLCQRGRGACREGERGE